MFSILFETGNLFESECGECIHASALLLGMVMTTPAKNTQVACLHVDGAL